MHLQLELRDNNYPKILKYDAHKDMGIARNLLTNRTQSVTDYKDILNSYKIPQEDREEALAKYSAYSIYLLDKVQKLRAKINEIGLKLSSSFPRIKNVSISGNKASLLGASDDYWAQNVFDDIYGRWKSSVRAFPELYSDKNVLIATKLWLEFLFNNDFTYDEYAGSKPKETKLIAEIDEIERRLVRLAGSAEPKNPVPTETPNNAEFLNPESKVDLYKKKVAEEKIINEKRIKKERELEKNRKAALKTRSLEETFRDTPEPSFYSDIENIVAKLFEWEITAKHHSTFYNSTPTWNILYGDNDNRLVFDVLPLSLSPYKDKYLVVNASIVRRIDSNFIIVNRDGKEAIAHISESLIASKNLALNNDYNLFCRLENVVEVSTVSGATKSIAKLEVAYVLNDSEMGDLQKFIAGHPEKFPPEEFIRISK